MRYELTYQELVQLVNSTVDAEAKTFCVKAQVRALCVSPSGATYAGGNWIDNPVTTCPRAAGEDYTKCKTVCRQPAHGEVSAITAAGNDARGSVVYLTGHKHCCDGCLAAMKAAGVSRAVVLDTSVVYDF